MTQPNLPSGSAFRLHFSVLTGSVTTFGALLILVYLIALLHLPADQVLGLFVTAAVVAVAVTPPFTYAQTRLIRPVCRGLDALAEGEPDAGVLREGFARAVDLPRRFLAMGFLNFQIAALAVVIAMALQFAEFRLESALITMLGALSGGIVAVIVDTFILKHWLEPIRTEFARRIPDLEERAALVVPFPLAWKLGLVLLTTALVPVIFTILMSGNRADTATETLAMRFQQALLARTNELWPKHGAGAVPMARDEARRWDMPVELLLVDLDRGTVLDGPADLLTASERHLVASARAETGNARELHSENVVSWQRLPKDADDARSLALVSASPRNALTTGTGSAFAILLIVSAAVALGVSWLVARDVGHAADTLRQQVERVAAGDLRPADPFEAEDELGMLGRSFARMAFALRTTVGRVAETADSVEGTAGEIDSISQTVGTVAADQVRGVQRAAESMTQINQDVSGIAASATALNSLVEESSSSILEMGAAGEELRDTAGVLSSKVDEVSTSLEEMTRSVKHVSSNTEDLSTAASDTASSMEEMASAMRQVDNTAEQTAELSTQVVESAEIGRQKVRETIEGMQSIRSATEAAQQVIHGLGKRTKAIGAILDVIDDVAERTNLLALNASIIAAQAGEHGRAFSVVGDEIKELADRVLSSTKEIGGLIHAVQSESENAIGAIEAGSRSVADGVARSTEAGKSLEEITSSAKESGTRIQQIVLAVREQTRAAAHVVEMMERVSGGVEQIRSATEQQDRGNEVVSRSAVAMRDVAQQLRGTTEEQARGANRIRQNIEGVRDAAEAINNSLQSQSAACSEAVRLLDTITDRTRSNEESGQRMGRATRELSEQAETLREDVSRFRL